MNYEDDTSCNYNFATKYKHRINKDFKIKTKKLSSN